eukprot:CAMPEP_0116868716 /NCGR_PEP_ID=MMETSP0418-20121206/27355_1 /TAXON_ID=1158023 /ORGANISM="Astrosyne radiata, Strain 13vi08-1A" /LENGTH=147 /DNA_ID=CAMNT_0004504725 /DNA_START=646 /DNA_END=1090 /DNA_ORIENTATION=-
MGNKVSSLLDELIDLRIASKPLQRISKKCEANEKALIEKVKKEFDEAIKQANNDGARIHAQNAIREENQVLNHLRLASRVDVCARSPPKGRAHGSIDECGMKRVVRTMDKSLASMGMDEISAVMDRFEKHFDDLDVRSRFMEASPIY